ncbi:MAG: hypothetical protein ACM3ZE_31800 [Myxococcales bacterium]
MTTQYTPEQIRQFQELELKHRHLSARNPILAARFMQQHQSEILEARGLMYGAAATVQPLAREPQLGDLDLPTRRTSILDTLGVSPRTYGR